MQAYEPEWEGDEDVSEWPLSVGLMVAAFLAVVFILNIGPAIWRRLRAIVIE